jgi:hypothetical protein
MPVNVPMVECTRLNWSGLNQARLNEQMPPDDRPPGYGTVASNLGLPDAGLASYADMVGRVEAMARLMGFEEVWRFDRAHAEI